MDILIISYFFYYDLHRIITFKLNFPLFSNYPIFAQLREKIRKISLKIYDTRFSRKI